MSAGGLDGKADRSGRGCQPRVERRQRGRPRRGREGEVKRVGGAQRRLRQAQEELFRPAMDVASRLDAVIHTDVEASEDGMLKASRSFPRE